MILHCSHCTSVHILVGGEPDADVCTKLSCRGIMERLTDPKQISVAVLRATMSAYTRGPHA